LGEGCLGVAWRQCFAWENHHLPTSHHFWISFGSILIFYCQISIFEKLISCDIRFLYLLILLFILYQKIIESNSSKRRTDSSQKEFGLVSSWDLLNKHHQTSLTVSTSYFGSSSTIPNHNPQKKFHPLINLDIMFQTDFWSYFDIFQNLSTLQHLKSLKIWRLNSPSFGSNSITTGPFFCL